MNSLLFLVFGVIFNPFYAQGSAIVQFKLNNKVVMTDANFKLAKAIENQETHHWEVAFELNETGTKKFAKITKNNIGKELAIFLDGKLLSAPVIQTEISGGRGVLSVQSKTKLEAEVLAKRINTHGK